MAIACSTSLGHRQTLDETCARLARLGFRHVDILAIDGWVHIHTRDLAGNFESTAAGVEAILASHTLTPLALNSGVGPQLHDRSAEACARRQAEIAGLLRLMQRLGVGVAAIQPRNPDPQRPEAEVLSDCIATLREQFAAGDAAGVQFALELHVRSPFETLEQARRLFAALPEARVVYDPTHAVCQGIDLAALDWVLPHARHVHLRDAAPGQLQAPFGEGAVDFDRAFGMLKDAGYQGHFSIEYFDAPEFDVEASVLRLRDKIASHFGE